MAPSILSADFGHLLDDIKKVEEAGVELLHIDIMDGHYVPNISFGPVVLKSIKGKTSVPFDVHLMIETQITILQNLFKVGLISLLYMLKQQRIYIEQFKI